MSTHRFAEKFIPVVAIGDPALGRLLVNHASATGHTGAETVSVKEGGEEIGLSIVKHLCELLRSTLMVETPAGEVRFSG